MTAAAATPTRHQRGRGALSGTFGILAVIGVLASVLSVWAHQTLFETRVVARAVDRALLEPEVVDALADHLTDQLFDAVPVATLVEDRLAADLAPLAPLVVGGLRALVHDGISDLLAEDATRRIVVGAAERGHRTVMRVLDDGRLVNGLTVEDDTATVNLLPLLGRALELVQGAGLLTGVDLPRFDRAGDPAVQIRELERALDRPLPDDFGQLVVYDSERLAEAGTTIARAQQALVLFRRSVVAIVAVTVVSFVAALAFAVRRRRALILLSLGVVGAMGVGRGIIREVVDAAPGLAVRPGARAAIRSVVTTVADGLLSAVTVALVVALVATALAYVTGPRGPARSIRASLHRNRRVVALATLAATVAVLSLSAFSLVPLASVVGVGTVVVATAWVPPAGPGPHGAPS